MALARDGVTVNSEQAYVFEILAPIYSSTPECRALFMPEGRVPREGDVLRDPEMADSLERLGAEGAAPFYEGDIGAAISDRVCELGGTLTREDLAAYEARAARAGAGPLPRPRGAHQPAAERGRHPARLRARAAPALVRDRRTRWRSWRRWSAPRPSARPSS